MKTLLALVVALLCLSTTAEAQQRPHKPQPGPRIIVVPPYHPRWQPYYVPPYYVYPPYYRPYYPPHPYYPAYPYGPSKRPRL